VVIPTYQERQDPSWQFNPQRTLLDESMIAGGTGKRYFKLHIIYPKKNETELPGEIYDAAAGGGRGNFAYTGDWELNGQQMSLLEERLRRALGESGVEVLGGMKTYHSEQGVDEWRVNWGPPAKNLGIGNVEYPDEIVPVYLIRGLGAYAGGSAPMGSPEIGKEWSASFLTMGDSVIESLAGFEGKTSYELIQNFESETGATEAHANFASYQSQMGTVLHEAFHSVAALPHRTDGENPEGVLGKGMLGDYVDNYLGAHGAEFAKVLDDSMRGKQGTDKFAALNLIMNESWNYRWGQPEQIVPDPKKEIIPGQPGQSIPSQVSAIPTSTQGPLIETVERRGDTGTTERTDVQGAFSPDPTSPAPLIETVSRTTKTYTTPTPNADIVNDMFTAMGLSEDQFIQLQETEARRVGGTGRTGRTVRTGGTGASRDILGQEEMSTAISAFPTEGPLIQTIPRLRGQ
jgi:hypothetical protein